MIEIIELFMASPIELQVILLGGIVIGVHQMFKDKKDKDKY